METQAEITEKEAIHAYFQTMDKMFEKDDEGLTPFERMLSDSFYANIRIVQVDDDGNPVEPEKPNI